MKTLWMKVNITNKELPLGVYDSVEELAKADKTTKMKVMSAICNARKRAERSGKQSRCKYVRVEYTDDEYQEDL